MTENSTNVLFKPTEKQQEFLDAVASNKYRHLMYGGAVGGGKTYLLCALALMLCRMFPKSRWAIVRKDNGSIVHNLMNTFNQVLPQGFLKHHNKTHKIMTFQNDSQIVFFAASPEHDPDLNRWRGLEVSGVFIDEANEVPREVYQKAVERSGRWNPPGMPMMPPPYVILTCNPATNWVKTEFYDKWKAGSMGKKQFYLPAYATDNPFIAEETREAWEALRETDPVWYERFILGNWDLHDEPNQLIKPLWVYDAFERATGPVRGEQFLGVDVARFGDDETVIAHRIGNRLVSLDSWKRTDLVQVADFVEKKILEHRILAPNVRIDSVGVGGGVVDILRNRGHMVSSFVAGETAKGIDRFVSFANLRSEAWWSLRKMFEDGIIEIDPKLRTNLRIQGDLCAPTYEMMSERRVKVEPKKMTKKRLHRSTDYGDAIMQAFAFHMNIDWLRKLNTM